MKVIVCGAGAAGLAAAATLQRSGADVTVLERADAVGASWRSRYDGLRLNTTARMSALPGMPCRSREYGEFPSRDDWVRYLGDFAAHHRLHVRFGVEVTRITRAADRWIVETSCGPIDSDIVVVAVGHDCQALVPDWPGRDGFGGELLHSSAYRNADRFGGRAVLVVGPNVTGTEIAHHLVAAGAARVWVSCRTPPNLIQRKIFGVSVNVLGMALERLPVRVADAVCRLTAWFLFGDLQRYGLPAAGDGVATRLRNRHQAPAYDDGFVADLKAGHIDVVPAVCGFDGDDVLLDGGARVRPDVVIAATGYRCGLERLVGHLGVLDDSGRPVASRGHTHPEAPGLYFNGYRVDMTGQLRLMRRDAEALSAAVERVAARLS
ncbi:NAD(P)/FAD-dependent oxidoreductase [Mycobacterium sp. Y57]|uniref:flavin-containing monooxygenase n=1 Tax=Mycolicibacterium xanthum TaxID=2796469 RepID=UPI001C850194|nr:NAD(P)/FAD-dependent oxidoreductase [Mycolicibacterium xanthum]MBX7435076.1 NAD(P)/FAD-dependent oxidoreductase [Mycolicibacterium xanthum]